jgi:glycosyltransferase involved in cell wall biosynthesis
LAHILQAAAYGGPYAGSFIPTLTAVGHEAQSRGHTFGALFTPTSRDRPWLAELEEGGIPYSFANSWDRADNVLALAAAIPATGPALIDTHFTAFDIPAVRVARSRRPDVSVVWHLHTALSSRWSIRLSNAVKFRLPAHRPDRIVAVSPHLAEAAIRRLAPRSRTTSQRGAIDVGRFAPRTPDRVAHARQVLDVDDDRPVVLHFGRDWHLKGGDLLLDALGILASRREPPLVLTVAGPEASRQAAALGLDRSVRTLEPALDVAELYTAADVFVSSSRAEGGAPPYSVMEAAACGAAVLVTAIPGQADLPHELPGARAADLTPASLATELEALLDRGPDRVAADRAAGRAWVEEHADVRHAAREIVDLYETIMGGG